jgi:HlyD family secretion protein
MNRTLAVAAGVGIVCATSLFVLHESLAAAPGVRDLGVVASSTPTLRAEGRLVAYPGAEVALSFEVPGTIAFVASEKALVKKGQVVAVLATDEQRATLAEARARLAEAEADVRFFELQVSRYEQLVQKAASSREELDRARHDRDAGGARRDHARATIERLEAALAKATLRAPIDGVVTARPVENGETVTPGARVLTVSDLSRIRIEAEVDEFDAGRVALGARVTVTAEGWEGSWRARVEEIPDAVVGRRLKPQDPGRPADTRVLLVKIALEDAVPVKLSQRVEVEIAAPR